MPDFAPVNSDTISINGIEYRLSDLSFSDLCVHYFTGVAVRKLGDQHSKSSSYRNGVMTGIGDLAFPVWETLVRDLIHRSGERDLLYGKDEFLHKLHEGGDCYSTLATRSGTSVHNGFDKTIIKPARIHIFHQSAHSISCTEWCTIESKEVD